MKCKVNIATRKHCKYCRFERCQDVAGMKTSYVLSAQIPKQEKMKSKNRKNVQYGTDGTHEKEIGVSNDDNSAQGSSVLAILKKMNEISYVDLEVKIKQPQAFA